MVPGKRDSTRKSLRLNRNTRRKEKDEDRKWKGREGCFLQGLVRLGGF